MPGSLSVRKKNAQRYRENKRITKGQSLSTYKPGAVESFYDLIGSPLAALYQRLGMDEPSAYQESRKLGEGVEALAAPQSLERVARGTGHGEDYVNAAFTALPFAGKPIARVVGKVARAATPKIVQRGAKALKDFAVSPSYLKKPEAVQYALDAKLPYETLDLSPLSVRVGPARTSAPQMSRELPSPPTHLALPTPGPGLPPYAIKTKGGQWWPDREVDLGGYTGNFSPEASAREIFRARFPDLNPALEPETAALRTWFERAVPRYIKNELGTPEDPLRSLAEQGLLHLPDLSPEGWSKTASVAITREPIGDIMFPKNRKGGMPGAGNDYRGGILSSMPWLAKAPVTDELYSVTPSSLSQLNLPHVLDEMQQALYPEHFGIPPELAVRPESLDRMSFAAAVERAGKIGQWRSKQMEQAALDAQNNPVTHIFKEYTEDNPKGLRWVEMAPPKGDGPFNYDVEDELSKALKYEGDTMGHCVGGYCPDVMSGKSRIFSLRDAKGEPHVTIETQPSDRNGAALQHLRDLGVYDDWVKYSNANRDMSTDAHDLSAQFLAERGLPPVNYGGDDIIQIKGKQNRAPKDDYLPFVQDFVKSQQWGNVGDLGNTGLVRLPDGRYITKQQWDAGLNSVESPWRNPGQYDERYLDRLSKAEWDYMAPYFEGYAIGGRVDADRCFCHNPLSVKKGR